MPLAEFFVLKLLGRYPNFDQLPSLDKQLHASLEMLKQHHRMLTTPPSLEPRRLPSEEAAVPL